MKRFIDTKCGIWETHFVLTRHRNGTITVQEPVVNWVNNSGNLAHLKHLITRPSTVQLVKQCFDRNDSSVSQYLECR